MFTDFLKKIKKNKIQYLSNYSTDIHSHLIPGIDDGVKTLEESIEIITKLKEFGYKKLITTPHIMSHRFPNTKNIILSGLEKVQNELLKRNIDIQIKAASEYYYDDHFLELIRKKDLLTFGSNYVLFELSYTTKPLGLEQVVFELLNAGYKPILAHPERYSYYSNNLELYENLKDLGLLFQINLNSLNSFYGKKPKNAAKFLVDNSLVDFIGSDIHNIKYLNSLKNFIEKDTLNYIFEKNQIKNDFI